MVYSKSLAARIRQRLDPVPATTEKRMFGGVAWLLHGNMLVGVWEHSLIARLGLEHGEQALTEPFVTPFNVTGRAMRGWVMVGPEGLDTETQLDAWLARAQEFVATLPPK